MAYQRELNTVVPVLAAEHTEVDDAVLVWLTCESFHRVAESEHLVITEWADLGDMDLSGSSEVSSNDVATISVDAGGDNAVTEAGGDLLSGLQVERRGHL